MKIFSRPRDAYKAMMADITAAKKSVDLEMYIFDGLAGEKFLKVINAAARRGVHIRLLIDAFANSIDLEQIDPVIDVRLFHTMRRSLMRYAYRNHRKLLILDNRKSYVGSANIADEFLYWRELTVMTTNGVVALLKQSFERHWELSESPKKTRYPVLENKKFKVFDDTPESRRLERFVVQTIARAKKRIAFHTPYLIPPLKFRHALKKAARRGVDVCVVVPWRSDYAIMDWVRDGFAKSMKRKGIRIYYYKKCMYHTKLLLVDDIALFGSSNFDYRSLRHQYELMIATTHKTWIESFNKYHQEIIDVCSTKEPLEHWEKFLGRMLQPLASFL